MYKVEATSFFHKPNSFTRLKPYPYLCNTVIDPGGRCKLQECIAVATQTRRSLILSFNLFITNPPVAISPSLSHFPTYSNTKSIIIPFSILFNSNP